MTDDTRPAPDPTEPTTPSTPSSPAPSAPEPGTPTKASTDTQQVDPLRGSRTSGLWVGVIGLGLILVLLIIFIAQNTQTVSVTFLGWSGTVPLAVALLAATVAGLFLAGVAGTMRILQLRRRVRRG